MGAAGRGSDGNDEWQFVENTQGNLNDPDTLSTTFDSAENTQGNLNDLTPSGILDSVYSESDVECLDRQAASKVWQLE